MASFSYSDDEDQKRGAQQDKLGQPQAPSGPTPTFAELQRRGMPRPPPMNMGGGAPYGAGGPQMGPMSNLLHEAQAGAAASSPPPTRPRSYQDIVMGRNRSGGGAGGQHPEFPGFRPPQPPPPGGYQPTGELNQGNLEGYLYDMLANPTATPTYKHAMRQIGADIDTDASRRGVFYSTIPVGSYSEAGSQLAAGLQGRAYDQLRGYNQDYEQLLMALLGAT